MYLTLFTIGSYQVQSWPVLVVIAFLVAAVGSALVLRRRPQAESVGTARAVAEGGR